jgi:hypothetical protein
VFRNYRSIAVDNNRTTVVVSVSVVVTVLPNDNRFVTIPAVPIPKVFTVTIAITVTMTFTHGHAIRTYTDSDFFRSSRNCAANTHHGGYCYCVLDHRAQYLVWALAGRHARAPGQAGRPLRLILGEHGDRGFEFLRGRLIGAHLDKGPCSPDWDSAWIKSRWRERTKAEKPGNPPPVVHVNRKDLGGVRDGVRVGVREVTVAVSPRSVLVSSLMAPRRRQKLRGHRGGVPAPDVPEYSAVCCVTCAMAQIRDLRE